MNYKWLLNVLNRIPGGIYLAGGLFHYGIPKMPKDVFGITFSNPVGMGAGMDKNGDYYDILSKLGLSFAEIGPLSPENVRSTIQNIIQTKADCIPAVNIARSPKSVADSDITKDMVDTFSLAYEFADMFVLDCKDSCFDIDLINDVVSGCMEHRITCDIYKPVLLGIGSNLSHDSLDMALNYAMMSGLDGIVATGIDMVKHISEYTKERFPIIAYGNIDSPLIAKQLMDNGASLLALTNEINKQGPGYVKKILKYLHAKQNIKQ